MCGIGGIVGGDLRADERESAALRLQGALAHRGPDGAGLFRDGACVLVHTRLAILDPTDAGRQPMRRGPLAVTSNGEIYDFRARREELRRAGSRFDTGTDTEVLLALYAQDDASWLTRLRGMFAFALWDAPRGELPARPRSVRDQAALLRDAARRRTRLRLGGAGDSGNGTGFPADRSGGASRLSRHRLGAGAAHAGGRHPVPRSRPRAALDCGGNDLSELPRNSLRRDRAGRSARRPAPRARRFGASSPGQRCAGGPAPERRPGLKRALGADQGGGSRRHRDVLARGRGVGTGRVGAGPGAGAGTLARGTTRCC